MGVSLLGLGLHVFPMVAAVGIGMLPALEKIASKGTFSLQPSKRDSFWR